MKASSGGKRQLAGLLAALLAAPGPVWGQGQGVQLVWSSWLGFVLLAGLVAALATLNRQLVKARQRIQQDVEWRDQLVAELPVGVYELFDDPVAPPRFEFISDRALELFGVSREVLEADFFAVFRHFHPEDAERIRVLNEEGRRGSRSFEVVCRILENGQTRWIRIQSRPRAGGEFRRWAGIVSDVSEQVRTEQALAESERLLSSMSRLSNTGGWQVDVASGAVMWTEQTFAIHDFPNSAQPPLEQALAFYHSEDRRQLEHAIQQAMETGSGWDLTLRMTTAAGRELVTRSVCEPLVEDGKVTRLVGAFQDITQLVQQQRRAQEAEQRFRTILQETPIAILLECSKTGELLDGNPEACRLFGAESLEALIAAQDSLWADAPYDPARGRGKVELASTEGRQQFEWCARRLDGREIWLQVTLAPIRLDGRDCVLAACIDITARRQTELLLKESDERFRSLLMDVPQVAIQGYALDGSVHYWNRASESLYGYSESEATQANLLDLIIPPEARESVLESLQRVAAGGSIANGEMELIRKDGSRVTVYSSYTVLRRTGQLPELFCLDIDLSERKQHELELTRIANYDALTGLPNRNLLTELMREHCARAQRSGGSLAVCYLDLDNFKPINDTHGHAIGDRVLVELGKRLRSLLRGSDTVARLGGDEFVLLLDGFVDTAAMEQGLNRVLSHVTEPMFIDGLTLEVSCSIGVTLYPQDAEDPDTLLRHADQAMYRAKLQGRNRFSLFDALIEENVHQRQARLLEIRNAIDEDAFVLHFQPKIDLRTREVVGMEALVRWNHPERGLLPPADFLDDMAQPELESAFAEHVIERALQQMSAWLDEGLQLPVSVNISGPYLLSPNFLGHLLSALARHPDVPPDLLQLEILESAAVADLDRAMTVVNQVRLAGVQVSLDDFGTGYSSLRHLRSLPVDEVKIDRGFVGDMLADVSDYNIVRSVIGLAQTFGLRVVAEGVETHDHALALIELGCECAQGFAFARPMPAAEVPGWLAAWPEQATRFDWGWR